MKLITLVLFNTIYTLWGIEHSSVLRYILAKCFKAFKNAFIKKLELHGPSRTLAKLAAPQEFASLRSGLKMLHLFFKKLELHSLSRALAKLAAPQGFASLRSALIILTKSLFFWSKKSVFGLLFSQLLICFWSVFFSKFWSVLIIGDTDCPSF